MAHVAGLDEKLTRLQVQEQAEDSSGAPPVYEGRIGLDPILLDVERLVAALETGGFELTILRAQVESNERGLCRCGRRATSELSYAEEMDQRQDASSPSPPSSPPTDGSYQTPVTESVTRLIPVPEDVQLPSPTTSEEESFLFRHRALRPLVVK